MSIRSPKVFVTISDPIRQRTGFQIDWYHEPVVAT